VTVPGFYYSLKRISKSLSRKGLYEFLAKEFSSIRFQSQVLTIGAGGEVNTLLDQFAQHFGFQVVSFDIDEKRTPDILGDICSYNFSDGTFDVVVMSEVLEHVHSPHLALQNIYKTLKQGGKLILTTPFILPLHDRPHDYYRYTRYGLAFLLRDFEHVQIRERNSYLEAIDVLYVRLLQTESKRSRLLAYFFIPLMFIKQPITRVLSKLAATDAMTTGYTVTARKHT
jgi:SAM-dependent methyltransferase